MGKTFLFNYISSPEESKWWYPEEEESKMLDGKYIENYVG